MHKLKLLTHSCCAPCSTSVLERLADNYEVALFFYNPNIMPASEYERRLSEQNRLLTVFPSGKAVKLIEGGHDNEVFLENMKGFEREPEGGRRCERCMELRLGKTAGLAQSGGYDLFTTTLSVSPHKNSQIINRILMEKGEQYNVKPLCEDFKKQGGFKRSAELSGEYGLYRQKYCGCRFK